MKKRIIAACAILLAVATVLLAFSSCTESAGSDTSAEEKAATTSEPSSTEKKDETEAAEVTTSEATTAAVTTKTPETTAKPDETTKAPETTAKPDETTKTPETTAKPDETTKAPETTAKPDETTAPDETTEETPKQDDDYSGQTFTVFVREAGYYTHAGIYATEQTGDVINDQTLKRNQAVEQKYNIKIAMKTATNPTKELAAYIQADNVDFDIMLDQRNVTISALTSGYLGSWNDLGIDMTQSWWDANCAEEYAVKGKSYMVVNDVSYSNLSGARFLYFNQAVVEKYNLTSPYTYVDNNTWTLDNFIDLVKQVSSPSSDPSAIGVYGMLRDTGENNGVHMHLFTACGIKLTKWDDGFLASAIDGNTVTKLQNITDKLTQVLNSTYTLTYSEVDELGSLTGYSNMYEKGRSNFATGHFLFVQNGMGISSSFQNMEKGFGVVPNPKYDENQESYYHKVDRYALIWSMPSSSKLDRKRLATVTDYWAYVSSTTVMKAYYHTVTMSRGVDETAVQRNLDIVKNSIVYELGELFSTAIPDALNTGYTNGNISSKFTGSGQKAIDANLKKVNAAIAALEK